MKSNEIILADNIGGQYRHAISADNMDIQHRRTTQTYNAG